MANFRKSFNFRSGVQVDSDNFVVTPLGLVGIGTTVPTQLLDVKGTAAVSGLVTTKDLYVSGISTFNQVTVSGDTVTAGVVTASYFYGDGAALTNIPTSQWVDVDVGLGYTSIYAAGSVGIATTDPRYTLQIGDNPTVSNQYGVGINSSGDIYTTGIVTAKGFVVSGGVATFENVNISGVTTFGPASSGNDGDIDFQHDGATRAYWDSSAGTLNFKDGDGITLGTNEDFSISFDGSNTYLTNKSTNGASDLYIQSDEILLRRYDGGQTMAQFTEGGSVKLNYAGVTKIQTTQGGAIVSGGLSVSGVATVGILTSTGAAVIDGININAKSSTNTHIGKQAGNALVGGQQNVALGMYALLNNTNSNFNTAIGMQALGALGSITSSAFDRNTAVGSYCGAQLTTGVSNTFLGASAGSEITTGSWNTIVGRYDGNTSELDVRTSSNNVILSDGEGNIRFYANSNGNVGLGSTQPTTRLDVVGNVRVSGSSTISGSISVNSGVATLGLGNSSSILKFVGNDKSFNITNNETGNINMYLHNGDVGVSTGRFDWIYGQTNQELMSLNYDGKLGLGKTNPDNTLHVVGTSTVTGNAWFGGDVTIDGDLIIDTLDISNLTGTLTGSLVGNVNSTSGVSTFANVLVSSGSSLGIGTDNPIAGLDVRNETAIFTTIGVSTDSVYSNSVLSTYGNVIIDGGVGVGTNYFNPSGASLQLYAPLTELTEGHINLKPNSTVGFDTSDPKAVFDFSNVGSATTRPVMVVPNIDNTAITGIAQTPTGSIIFNTSTLKFQGYTGVGWTDFH